MGAWGEGGRILNEFPEDFHFQFGTSELETRTRPISIALRLAAILPAALGAMGKDDEVKGKQLAQKTLQKHADTPLAAQAGAGGTSTEARFLAALQAMMGDVELTDESVRQAIAKMTPEQKQQLMQDAGGQQLKRELLTNEETKQDRSLYFKEVNRSAEAAGLPVDKDNSHLTKKVRRAQRRLAAAAAWPICVRCPCQWAPHIS